jgi:hypothetical protein
MTALRPPRRPAPAAMALVGVYLIFVLALLLGVIAATIVWAPASWRAEQRFGSAVTGLLVVAAFGAIGAGVVRQTILGLPRASVGDGGLSIGRGHVDWSEIHWVGTTRFYGQRMLLVETGPGIVSGLPWYDSLPLRLWPPLPDGSRPLWINAQQLDRDVDVVLADVPTDKRR